VKYLNCRLQRAMGVRKRRDKVARSVIANDRDGATSGGWDGRQLTGQIDPTRALRVRAWERLFMPHSGRSQGCCFWFSRGSGAFYLQPARFEFIVERKLRRRSPELRQRHNNLRRRPKRDGAGVETFVAAEIASDRCFSRRLIVR